MVLVKMERFEDRPGFRSAIVLGAHPDEREVLRMTHEIARRYHTSAQYHTRHLRSKLFQP
ncbi:MAG TPA: hypothetical protein VH877_27915 [Polyangia bacterium]|nr:hypothetical protein [Polyangia bacterium]